ncbi:MAG: hypothetical protein Q8O87_00295 [bacterium]|nr:hypothetical protein [bacterium]
MPILLTIAAVFVFAALIATMNAMMGFPFGEVGFFKRLVHDLWCLFGGGFILVGAAHSLVVLTLVMLVVVMGSSIVFSAIRLPCDNMGSIKHIVYHGMYLALGAALMWLMLLPV